jgi:hypothetical protein
VDPIRFGKRENIKSQYNHPVGPTPLKALRKMAKRQAMGMLGDACYCPSCRELSPAKREAWEKQVGDVRRALETL